MSISLNLPLNARVAVQLGDRRILRPGPLLWLRAIGWALALFVIFMAVDAIAQKAAQLFDHGQGPVGVLATLGVNTAGLALYVVIIRLAEGRWPRELAPRHAVRQWLIGVAAGAAMMATIVGLLAALGLYDIAWRPPAAPWKMLGLTITSGVLEELVMRAVLLRLLMRAFGIWPALAVQAALFGVLHLGNPNATLVAAGAIAVEAGLMLAAFYLLTGRIWMSIGVHGAWNFTQGYIFGAAVSGNPIKDSLLLSAPRADTPLWLNGGAFGPEASLPAMIVGTSVAILVLGLAWRRGGFLRTS